MSITIELRAAPCKPDPKIVAGILQSLTKKGYEPLILQAKREFARILGGDESQVVSSTFDPEMRFELGYRSRIYARQRPNYQIPIAGDIFFPKNGPGLLCLILVAPEARNAPRSRPTIQTESHLQLAYVGDGSNSCSIEEFIKSTSESLVEQGIEAEWECLKNTSQQFIELSNNAETSFVSADSLSQEELILAQLLEKSTARAVAITARRAGGILIGDLMKRTSPKEKADEAIVESLAVAGLISKEYVVICKKTSNQTNRVDSKEKIEQMAKLGIRCSCGNSIDEERIEELIIPTTALQRMLDQSFWMSARLVRLLADLQVPEESILLNLQEGAEEIDSFVDIDGTLLMFELKDSEFSLGHAYPFGGRIGIYRPDYAIIVATRGIAPEVRSYFHRVSPGAEIIYIGSLDQLDSELAKLILQIRMRQAREIISLLEPMTATEVPLAQMLTPRLGLHGT